MRRHVMGADGRVTIPRKIREQANLREGDPVELCVTSEGVLLKRGDERDPDQAWFWTEEWQEGERRADADKAAGRCTRHLNDEAFRQALVDRMGRSRRGAPRR